jgi:hypothetical protein
MGLFTTRSFLQKTFAFCLLLWGVPSANCLAQTQVMQPFDLNDRETLLIRFFDADSISETGEVLWEPLTFSDLASSNVSSDGLVHTALDTIMYFNCNGLNKALVLFETLPYENGQVVDCHACGAQVSAAILDETGQNSWQVVKFVKHFTTQGSYGLNGESDLVQFGDNQWCLRLQMSWEGQGIYGEYVTFYNVDDFQKMFNFTLHEDNIGAFDEGSERAYAYDKTIHFIRTVETESGWWDFDMVMQGTQKVDDVDRAVPANEVVRYQFDWETSTYLKMCR